MKSPACTNGVEPDPVHPVDARLLRRALDWLKKHASKFSFRRVAPVAVVHKHTVYYDLRAALQSGYCPICHLVTLATDRFLDHLLQEYVNDPDLREDFQETSGFCERHAATVASTGNAMGLAIIYGALIRSTCQRISGPILEGSLSTQAHCLACAYERERDAGYIQSLAGDLRDQQMQIAYRTGHGLCVPHLVAVLSSAPRDVAEFLIAQEEPRLNVLASELEEFVRKNDHHYAGEPMGAQGDSWLRALEKMTGCRPFGNRRS